MGRNALASFLVPVLTFLVQVLVLKEVVLFGYAFCFIYVFILLQFHIEMNPMAQLLSAFVIGLLVDVFYNTLGMHASACTMLIFAKIYWIQVLTPSGGYDTGARVNLRTQGLQWFLGYTYPLVFIFCTILFFIEAGGFSMFWQTFGKAFYSSLFTVIMILIVQYLFYKKVK